jgi:hypothetical protein
MVETSPVKYKAPVKAQCDVGIRPLRLRPDAQRFIYDVCRESGGTSRGSHTCTGHGETPFAAESTTERITR